MSATPVPALGELEDLRQLTERVHDALREAIVAGRIAPNTRLVQEQVASDLGVSRTPVREALHLLEREGLVKLIPRRGAMVHAITAADVRELYEMREVLEPWAAERAAARAAPEQRDDVQRLAELTATAAQEAAAFGLNREFHRALCAPCGNRTLLRMLDGIWSQPGAYRLFTYQALRDGACERMAREHAEMAQAFAAADSSRLARLVRDHIASAGTEALARLQGGTPPTEG
jgi:DNA-binding GntR family transcriptional regulator